MAVPEGNHSDWPWPFKYLPRSWFAFESEVEPEKMWGTAPSHLDVPAPGTWAVTGYKGIPVMWAYTSLDGKKYRLGALRYDYEDGYWEIFTARAH